MKDAMTALAEILKEPWIMEPKALNAFVRQIIDASVNPMMAAGRGGRKAQATLTVQNGVAIIPVAGVLMDSVPEWYDWFGITATSYRDISAKIAEAVALDSVHSILLQVNSPGGSVCGVQRAADSIYAVRQSGRKTISANIESMGASGAYYLASQTQRITAEMNAVVGSIGTYMVMTDYSGMAEKAGIQVHVIRSGVHKGTGVVGAKITDEQILPWQDVIDGMADHFVNAVTRGRGMKKADVSELATGKVWLAPAAVKIGLIDGVEEFETALAALAGDADTAGVSSGNDSGNNVVTGEHVMPEDAKTQVQKPDLEQIKQEARASVLAEEKTRQADIKAAFPNDPAFALEQIAAGVSLQDAKVAYCSVLERRLQEKDARIAELEKQTTADSTETETRPKADANTEQKKPAAGGAAVPFNQTQVNGGSAGDFMAMAHARAKEKNIGITAAMQEIDKENPGMREKWLEGQRKGKKPEPSNQVSQ